MLNLIEETLLSKQLMQPWDKPIYEIMISTEQILTIQVLLPNNVLYHVRMIQVGTNEKEYENYRLAQKTYPQFVPPLLAHEVRLPWEIIVIRGVHHRVVTADRIPSFHPFLTENIIAFFVTGSDCAIRMPSVSHRQFLRQLRNRISDSICLAILDEWIGNAQIDTLPHIPQHCDFIAANFGEIATGLVIFDWEDFGAVNLPGFDLCILLASSLKFALCELMDGLSPTVGGYGGLIEESCAALGLTPQLFRQLIPLYLVIFLDLKKNYSNTIYEITRNAIHTLYI
ncbi:MAG: hypothetical protein ACRERU_17905 [Methylococcales bacterium]